MDDAMETLEGMLRDLNRCDIRPPCRTHREWSVFAEYSDAFGEGPTLLDAVRDAHARWRIERTRRSVT